MSLTLRNMKLMMSSTPSEGFSVKVRSLCAALIALATTAPPTYAHAQISIYTSLSAYLAAITAPGTDTFSDISVTEATSSPLFRTAGLYSYRATAFSAEGPSVFFGAGTASDPALSSDFPDDIILFDQFSSTVRGIGGNFYGTEFLGEFLTGTPITLTAITADGFSRTVPLNPTSPTDFFGFVSSGSAFLSLTVTAMQSGEVFAYPTVDNLVLGSASAPITAVPEPQTYAMLAVGLAVIGFVRRKRTA